MAGRVDTRARLVTAGVQLFQRQGLAATGIKEILSEADTGFSSLYHHFPGGKDDLAAEVIRTAGALYQQHVEAIWDDTSDPASAMTAIFRGAASALEVSDYADVCPVATVAMEVASTNEPLRIATAEVFAAWIDAAAVRLRGAGISKVEARRLASTIVGLLEGAFILCRASRTTAPMLAAGQTAASLVKAALSQA
jgi:AcrR family transcriptional regulator